MSPRPVVLRQGTLITQNKTRDVFVGDLLISDNKIKKVAKKITAPPGAEIIDCSSKFISPGLIQSHTHLCQALFRGLADDMALIDWLKKRIWPLESTHTEDSIRASAQIALLEMHLLGTTTILDMATVKHTATLLDEVANSGMRYFGGKCLMDHKTYAGPLHEDTDSALLETETLLAAWNKKNPLIEYALCPRFAVSCTEELLLACAHLQKKHKLLIHTHASESLEEIAIIKKRTKKNNIDYLADLGFLNPRTVIVHGVHMSKSELEKMVKSKTGLAHCPSSNLKLGSGIAPTHSYHKRGLRMGIGSDGAPCNNTMDPFLEMRLAALIQKPLFGPTALPARAAYDMATLGGAKILGRAHELGSLEEGKCADVITIDRSHPSLATVEDPYSALVYSASGRDVNDVFIQGRPIVRNRQHQVYSQEKVVALARKELKSALQRAL